MKVLPILSNNKLATLTIFHSNICLSLPLQIGIALYLLYTQVKFAFLSGLAITILLIPVNKWISVLIASATEKMMKLKDERCEKTFSKC
jgi:small-conductance mechanosensitive channel